MKVHFTGIGGVGMSGLAVLLKNRGNDVNGCDLHAGKRTAWLESLGIPVFAGHDPRHVRDADVCILTPAVPADSPERAAMENPRFRGDVLAEIVSSAEDSIAVCGSHGKTTTATFIAKLLLALGEDVEWAIGGETGNFPVAGGKAGGVLVVEADESDGTLANYRAGTLVVTNCEYDHPDRFKTVDEYRACFDAARAKARDVVEGTTLAPIGEIAPLLDSLAPHNRANARTAVEVALRRGHSLARIASVLSQVTAALPDRRFQRLAEGVYTDYGHHPTEMRCAVAMARRVCRGTLRVLFQPHRYSRTRSLLDQFPSAFEGADEVVLCPTYAAFEKPVEGGTIADLYAACRAAMPTDRRLFLARSCGEAWEHARDSMKDGDVTLLLGAGDIIAIAPRIARESAQNELPPCRRIWIGQGTNTWKSDLNLRVEYVRTDGPADRPGAALGIPWMAGIPGTIGGWVKMNAGAFGHSISEVLDEVLVDGTWRKAAECGFSYRHSDIEGEIRDIRLKPDGYVRGEKAAADFLARRRKFPAGTKGSVFKNPPGDFAGRLLETAGAKDLRVGGARVWEEHANVIVAESGATASDFLALAQLMQSRVYFRFGIILEPEVRGIENADVSDCGARCHRADSRR